MTGRYVATSYYDRREPEWPPHPARLFSALVAVASERGELAEHDRHALQWLECQGAPRILASRAEPRTALTTYVPENTTRVLGDWSKQEAKLDEATAALDELRRGAGEKQVNRAERALATASRQLAEQIARSIEDDGRHTPDACSHAQKLLPQHRGKQPRMLPSVTPTEPRVRYVWPDAEPDEAVRSALADLAGRLVRLGHASSLVCCRVVDSGLVQDGLDVWEPCTEGDESADVETLRIIEAGQLAHLLHAYARHRGVDPRVLPARHQPYRRGTPTVTPDQNVSVFGEWIVLREVAGEDGHRIGLAATRAEDVTRALRGALLHHAEDPAPAVLTGHAPDGSRLEQPHVAFLALPDVGSSHAHGRVLGAAIVMPRSIDAEARRAVLRAVGRWEEAGLHLMMGRVGRMRLERIVERDPRSTLDPRTWTRASRRWASVTPVALDENPGDLSSRDPHTASEAAETAEQIVARACERTGLPSPAWVQVMRRSLFEAAPAARRFMPFPRKDGALRRVCVHAEILFTKPVAGPVLLGAGRYFGIGLCRPPLEDGARKDGK